MWEVLWEEDLLGGASSVGPGVAAAAAVVVVAVVVVAGVVGPAAAAGIVAAVAGGDHFVAAGEPESGPHLRGEPGAERIALNAFVYGRLPSISKRLSKAE